MKKNSLLILALVITTMLISASGTNLQEEKKIIYTTLDVKQNYEVIQIIASTADMIGSSGLKLTTVDKAYNEAWTKFIKVAETVEADAVVGVRVEMENMSGQIVGRMLIYGTAVKFIE